MIKNILTGTIDYISDVVTDESNLPYKTVHFLDSSLSEEDSDINEFFDNVLLDEIETGIVTKEQADEFQSNSSNNFQSVIVFYDYKTLDKFKVKDFVCVIFDEYDEPLAKGSSFHKSILKVGIYITNDYKEAQSKISEYIDAMGEQFNN